MREILFRAKTKDTKCWIEGYYAIESNHACFANELKHTHFIFKDEFMDWGIGGLVQYEVIPETVGQYTGLTDKNGKKIFEGDIAKLYSNDYIPTEYIGEVMIKDGLAGIEYTPDCLRGKGFDPYFHHFGYVGEWRDMGASGKVTYSYEIIGNIHDNPELLKGE